MPMKVYDGSKWVIVSNINTWDGTSWVPTANGSVWNGSSWVRYHPGIELEPNYYGYAYTNTYALGAFAQASITVHANGHIQTAGLTNTIPSPYIWQDSTWLLSGNTSDYDVKIIDLSTNGGVLGGSMSENTLYSTDVDRNYTIYATWGNSWFADFTVQILANNTGTILSSTPVSLIAEAVPLA